MQTVYSLIAQYGARAVIPVDIVVRDFFPHLNVDQFIRKVNAGNINIPLIRIDPRSRKTAKGVHTLDLAIYIDTRIEAALKEANNPSYSGVARGNTGAT